MVNWWFGSRWFGFLGSPYERDCYLRVPLESQTTYHPKPPINHQLTWWRLSFGPNLSPLLRENLHHGPWSWKYITWQLTSGTLLLGCCECGVPTLFWCHVKGRGTESGLEDMEPKTHRTFVDGYIFPPLFFFFAQTDSNSYSYL